MMALLVGVFAQTCAALLPLQNAEIEWFRDGRPWARDVPVTASATSRVYRREHANGRVSERSITCSTTRGTAFLADRVDGVAVSLPVSLAPGSTATVASATVRRIEPPADAGRDARSALWFSVSSPGIAVYGVARGSGIVEIRTPASSGGFSILRAVRRAPAEPAPALDSSAVAESAAQRRALLDRIALLEQSELLLRDSIAVLRAALDSVRRVPESSADVVEFIAVDVYVERGELQTAIDLLQSVTRRLRGWSDSTGTRHRALDAVDARLHQVLALCASAAAEPRRARAVSCTLDGSQ
jgi:hypothetical protein